MPRDADSAGPRPGAAEVLVAFLRLGLTSFGGPVAHLGYFRTEFVERRRWLDERAYADLVALCQFLPGPASSQVGMALGLARGGWWGALAAWAGFTLPSAIALVLFAWGLSTQGGLAASGAVHGLKVAAVAIVAQAVWGMGRSLCPDRPRLLLAILSALITLALPGTPGQVGAIVASGLLGAVFLKLQAPAVLATGAAFPVSKRTGLLAAAVFAVLLGGLPLLAWAANSDALALIDGFYRAGALVFGGGHVVLPLLQSVVVPSGFVSDADFLAGYGVTQAMPGPLFTFAAYLGAVMSGPLSGVVGATVLLAAVFLPAFLLVVAALPFWEDLRRRPGVQSTMGGVNAGVVGLLLSALYDPVWTHAVHSKADFGLALAAFGLLVSARWSPALVVLLAAAAGWLLGA